MFARTIYQIPAPKATKTCRELYEKLRRMNDPAYLPTVTMAELYDTVYESKPPVIEGLLQNGTYIFAGAPKVGKSFLMAQLAYHVATGQKLWDLEVHQGTVLYLALEDGYERLQRRMYRMFGVRARRNCTSPYARSSSETASTRSLRSSCASTRTRGS